MCASCSDEYCSGSLSGLHVRQVRYENQDGLGLQDLDDLPAALVADRLALALAASPSRTLTVVALEPFLPLSMRRSRLSDAPSARRPTCSRILHSSTPFDTASQTRR